MLFVSYFVCLFCVCLFAFVITSCEYYFYKRIYKIESYIGAMAFVLHVVGWVYLLNSKIQ